MNEVTKFEFNGNDFRSITDETGIIWFVAKDVCDILGLESVGKALERIPSNHKGVNSIHTLGGIQQMSMVDEPGLYRLILRSNKPEAEPVMEWVTSEVLPTIRKTGGYRLDGKHTTGLDYRDKYIAILEEKIQWMNTAPHAGPVTDEEAQAMRADILSGMTTAQVAGKYGRAKSTVREHTRTERAMMAGEQNRAEEV